MARWIFVRHGHSVANGAGWLSGHRDVRLTPEGERQATSLKLALAAHRVSHVHSSDLVRAVDTARGALADRSHAIVTTPALRERHVGDWTGRTWAEIGDEGHEVFMSWHRSPPGGESLADVAARAVPCLAALEPRTDVLVVAHGGVLRVLLGLADGLRRDEIPRRPVDNAVPFVRDLSDDHWRTLDLGGLS